MRDLKSTGFMRCKRSVVDRLGGSWEHMCDEKRCSWLTSGIEKGGGGGRRLGYFVLHMKAALALWYAGVLRKPTAEWSRIYSGVE